MLINHLGRLICAHDDLRLAGPGDRRDGGRIQL